MSSLYLYPNKTNYFGNKICEKRNFQQRINYLCFNKVLTLKSFENSLCSVLRTFTGYPTGLELTDFFSASLDSVLIREKNLAPKATNSLTFH